MKSPPELWELADDMPRMQAWMGDLVGIPDEVRVLVTDREPQRMLAWRTAEGLPRAARISLELSEKGFGTAVSITAENPGRDPADVEAALEHLLDELAAPERRPFARR